MKRKHFGEYLRSLRLEKRIGLRQFAKAVGILPSNLCHIESGRHSSHQGKEFIEKVAKALQLEEGSKEYEKLFDLAAHPGEIPADVKEYFNEHDLMQKLPVMARTIKNSKMTRTQIERLIEDLKKKK